MSLQTKLLAWLVSVAMVFAVLFGAYEYGRRVEGLKRDKELLTERLQYADAFNQAQSRNDELKTQGAKQHAKDTETINRMRDDLSAFRLRLPKPPACDGVPNSASGDVDSAAGGGLRAGAEQAAFDRFTVGLKQDSYEIDTALNACRVVMNWARSLCQLNNSCVEKK